jgi:hypothetical protein
MASALGPRTLSHWSRLRKLGNPGYYSTVAIDARGTLHAAWTQGVGRDKSAPCWGCADVFYSRSGDRGHVWSPPTNVSHTPWGSEKPQVAFGANDTVFIAWEEGRDFPTGRGQPASSMLAVSDDGGRTWGRQTTFTFPDDAPQSIALGVDGADQVVVVWQQTKGDGIFYQVSSDRGGSWSPPLPLVGLQTRSKRIRNWYDGYDMAADAGGHLHLVATGRPADAPVNDLHLHVYHVEWDGNAWRAPQSIFTTLGAPEWPRIAVGNGNQLHAVWFERPEDSAWRSDKGDFAVWYARGESGAPAVPPVVWPTPSIPFLAAEDVGRLVQLAAALLIFGTVVVTARRYGW